MKVSINRLGAENLLATMKAVEALDLPSLKVNEVSAFNYWPDWYETEVSDEEFQTECGEIHVSKDDVYWTAYPKHGTIQHHSDRLTLPELNDLFPGLIGETCQTK